MGERETLDSMSGDPSVAGAAVALPLLAENVIDVPSSRRSAGVGVPTGKSIVGARGKGNAPPALNSNVSFPPLNGGGRISYPSLNMDVQSAVRLSQ